MTLLPVLFAFLVFGAIVALLLSECADGPREWFSSRSSTTKEQPHVRRAETR